MHQCPSCHDSGDEVWMAWHSRKAWADRLIFAPMRPIFRLGIRLGIFDVERMDK